MYLKCTLRMNTHYVLLEYVSRVYANKHLAQRLSLCGARISQPEQDLVGLFSVSAGVGARESTLEDIGILSVVVLPYGMLVDELFVGLLDE